MKVVTKPKKVVRRTKNPQVDNPKQLAIEAVAVFEKMREDLADMEGAFSLDYPDAHDEMVAIDQFRDDTHDYLKKTKEMVRLAGETIGDFKYQAKSSTPGFNGKDLLDICVENDDGQLLIELARVGALQLKVVTDPARIYSDRHPEDAKKMMGAWEESKPMTPAITAPKL